MPRGAVLVERGSGDGKKRLADEKRDMKGTSGKATGSRGPQASVDPIKTANWPGGPGKTQRPRNNSVAKKSKMSMPFDHFKSEGV